MDIDDIKKKILEDVDPETKRKRAHERRVQRFVIALQSIAVIIVVLLIFYMLMGISTVQGNSMYPTLHDQDVVIYKGRIPNIVWEMLSRSNDRMAKNM